VLSLIVLGNVNSKAFDRDRKPTALPTRPLQTDPFDGEPRFDLSVLVSFGSPFDPTDAPRADGADLHLEQTFQKKGYQDVSQSKSCGSQEQEISESGRDRHG